ncbi:hypothetical protein HOLleu_02339 [Holothuria leucospilota]|uniref:Tesmin/TSO1-like CXC domain-containing protein n=1 Tax=Holothuria leucospilota TaxID=206669 RepID=A0A9Q1CRI1_HOLLE|nr:hypothetical protein HOLleu_02339 [Holothuria leucospilota]
MATSTDETSGDKEAQKLCFMCISPSSKAKIVPFSSKTWSKFLQFVEKWKSLLGEQAQIAKEFIAKQASDSDITTLTLPQHGGFYQACYSRFTDSQRVDRVTKRLKKTPEESASTDPGDGTSVPAKRRLLLSSIGKPASSRNQYVLPEVCILCQKNRTVTCRATRKRRREPLVRCSTVEAEKLQQAARDTNNRELLLKIEDKDCVAIEVKYHDYCYRNFTRYLSKPEAPQQQNDSSYSEAFVKFCSVVQARIIENKEIMRLKRLNEMFIKEIHATRGVDASGYKTGNLKQRLRKRFPQLCFITPHMRSQGDIVYVDDIPTASLIEEKICNAPAQSTTESSDVDKLDLPQQQEPRYLDPLKLRHSYMTALELRKTIQDVKPSMPWPPTARCLNLQTAETVVPDSLYNFLAWTVGASDEPDYENRVAVPSLSTHTKLLSISQDIIALSSKGRKLMPKHMSLAMTVRHISGSAQLIGLLNGLGHTVSNSVVLNHDTALATHLAFRGNDYLPSLIAPDTPATIVWDNNDFGEETLSGRGTTHNTNGIIIQNSDTTGNNNSSTEQPNTKRNCQRSMKPPLSNLATYQGGKKVGPSPCAAQLSLEMIDLPVLQRSMRQDLAYFVTKFNTDKVLPSWTGFNQLLSQVEVFPKSVVGYLPVIDGSPTDMNTVLTILERSVEIADKLKLQTVVIVMDQAIYSKAQIIRWQNAHFMQRLVIRLGAFHTAMSYLGCIGKRFRDGGLQDLLVESEMRIKAYVESLPDDEAASVGQLMADLEKAFPTSKFHELVAGESYHWFQESYNRFINDNRKRHTFDFWSSYIEMVEELLLFLRATREGNWALHLASVRRILPWVFAYDHINYSRYLPVYWLEMSDLEKTHPLIHRQLLQGDFVVRRSEGSFAQVACDQAIEQTANRDSKTKGGMHGFTTSSGAVNRWIWSHHERGLITRECEIMAGKADNGSHTHADLFQSRMKRDKEDVEKIINTTNNMINPFEYEQEELINITSGVVAAQDITHDIRCARQRGDEEFMKFAKERIQTEEADLFEGMKKLKQKTFTDMAKTSKRKVKGKEIALKADRNLLARLVVVGRHRQIDLQHMLTYSLGPLPLSLANPQGSLVKTNKATLLHVIESLPEKPVTEIPVGGVYVIDGMALIQQLDINKLPGERTFHNLALVILRRLVSRANANKSKEIHFVTDTYREISIKNAEREKRAAGGSQLMRIHGQPLPKQWKKFLSNGENKKSLIEFLDETWSKVKTSCLKGVKVFLAHDSMCHSLSPGNEENDPVVKVAESGLSTEQEEADTRMYLHAAHAAKTCGDAIIASPDTDVFIIGTALQSQIPAHLFFHTGRGANLRTIDLKAVHDSIGDDVCQALIGLHCFTGCDSVSSFYGMGKKKAFNLLLKDKQLCDGFKDLGERFIIEPNMLAELEKFVCRLYGQRTVYKVNEARYNMFRLMRKSEMCMPPNQDVLIEHTRRANYQAAIYKRSLQATSDVPSPVGHGWHMKEGELSIHWMNLPPAPDSVMELAYCSGRCNKSKCGDAAICTCLQNNVPCTDSCKCSRNDCANISGEIDLEQDDQDDDDQDFDEQDEDNFDHDGNDVAEIFM